MPSKNDLQAFDNYLDCQAYRTAAPDPQGFSRFENDGLYFFSFLEGGQVVLRSEGYDNEPGRENGIQSVMTNMQDDANFLPLEVGGKWVLSLFAKNNQEIARTCPFNTKEEAMRMMPSARAASQHHRHEDDYLTCGVYASHAADKCEGHDDFICFRDPDSTKYYFAWMSPSGKVILRSEGYPDTHTRDKGLDSVIHHRDDRTNFLVKPAGQDYVVTLQAANKQEIGRSCPVANEGAFWLLFDEYASLRREDDYMVCREYEKYMSARCSGRDDFICFFHPVTKKYYFAWVTADDQVILRSEGYPTEQARDKGIEAVARYREDRNNFSVIESKGVYYLVLMAANNQEVGRSCPKSSAAALWALLAPATVAVPVVAAAPAAAAAGSKFKWWWLLPLLLIPLLFFLWRGCKEEPPKETATEVTPVEPAPVTPAAAPTDTIPDCGLHWVLFDFDQDIVVDSARAELEQVAQLLKEHAGYRVDLKGYTDERGSFDYNSELSNRRAQNCAQVLVGLGIDAARINASAMSESDPVAVNTTGDEGRHFNRRVEVYVLDANGTRICQSIEPAIPDNLRTK